MISTEQRRTTIYHLVTGSVDDSSLLEVTATTTEEFTQDGKPRLETWFNVESTSKPQIGYFFVIHTEPTASTVQSTKTVYYLSAGIKDYVHPAHPRQNTPSEPGRSRVELEQLLHNPQSQLPLLSRSAKPRSFRREFTSEGILETARLMHEDYGVSLPDVLPTDLVVAITHSHLSGDTEEKPTKISSWYAALRKLF